MGAAGSTPVAVAAAVSQPQWLARLVRVRAVYDARIDRNGTGLVSTGYSLCARTTSPATTAAPLWCGDGDGTTRGVDTARVQQRVMWSTIIPPGIFAVPVGQQDDNNTATASTATVAVASQLDRAFYSCASFRCDLVDEVGGSSGVNGSGADLVDAYGGLSPASPCCGSTNSTFILFTGAQGGGSASSSGDSASATTTTSPPLLVQTNILPLAYLRVEAQALLEAAQCARGEDCAATRATPAPASKCLLHVSDPRFYSTAAAPMTTGTGGGGDTIWAGDGGLFFPVSVSICGTDVSAAVSSTAVKLLQYGYTALITTRSDAAGISLPAELIRSVASWLALRRGEPAVSLLGTSSTEKNTRATMRHRTACTWHLRPIDTGASDTSGGGAATVEPPSAYRTGEYLSCDLDASLVGRLPPLTLTVGPGSVISATDGSGATTVASDGARVPCAFSLDLNRLVRAGEGPTGHRLVLHSSGSLTAATDGANPVRLREPFIAIGALFLDGATIAVSRAPSLSADNGSSSSTQLTVAPANLGVPVLFLAAANVPLLAEATAAATAVCAAPAECADDATFEYLPSLNLCGQIGCIGIFSYAFDSATMQCSLQPAIIVVFAVVAALLLAAEVVVYLVGRWTERQRRTHIKMIGIVQRKKP